MGEEPNQTTIIDYTNGTTSITVTLTPSPENAVNYNSATATYTLKNVDLPTFTENSNGEYVINYPAGLCGVDGVTCSYSINGGRLNGLHRGINIIKMDNGKSMKWNNYTSICERSKSI